VHGTHDYGHAGLGGNVCDPLGFFNGGGQRLLAKDCALSRADCRLDLRSVELAWAADGHYFDRWIVKQSLNFSC
jgi:hypothetical protein